MSFCKLSAAVAAVALLLIVLVPGPAQAGWHRKYYPALGRIYPAYPWGYPRDDLGRQYPMFGEWVWKTKYYWKRRYYYQLPPYWHCCW